jgi:hypothetical protein
LKINPVRLLFFTKMVYNIFVSRIESGKIYLGRLVIYKVSSFID